MSPSPSPCIIRLVQAAYIAKDTIDRVHDLTSLDTAGQAFLNLTRILVETSQEDQERARAWAEGVPVLDGLAREFCAAAAKLGNQVQADLAALHPETLRPQGHSTFRKVTAIWDLSRPALA